jgi:hypothetical protein
VLQEAKVAEWTARTSLMKIAMTLEAAIAKPNPRGDQRMMLMVGITSASIATRRILAIPPYILI